MGLGFSFKVAPGVRVRVSSRGIRTSVGPRAARAHVGAGRPGVSTGAGPVSLFADLDGPTRRSSTPPPEKTSARQLAAQERAAEKEQEAARLSTAIAALRSLHQADFLEAERPVAAPPPDADPLALVLKHQHAARRRTRVFDRAARKRALLEADQLAQQEWSDLTSSYARQHAAWQAKLGQQWADLLVAEPKIVSSTLTAAFADNDAGAHVLAVRNGEAVVAVVVPSPADLPERFSSTTPAGNLSLTKLTKTDHASLYTDVVCGHTLLTVKEALAVAPGLSSVRVLAVRRGWDDLIELMLDVRFKRSVLAEAPWRSSAATHLVERFATELRWLRKGVTRALQPLPLDEDDAAVLDGLAPR